ncbi:hypothetical protein [Sphingomonas azotifigens]|uniref:hypothetical protein n=1 Tax=Sphingomonas azotifigens TaxID=330920 RepID=UPI00157D677D|nr:hypothetical protein [Sphingomonas azotifigens]
MGRPIAFGMLAAWALTGAAAPLRAQDAIPYLTVGGGGYAPGIVFSPVASPFAAGELRLKLGAQLWRSTDGGASFVPASGALQVELFGLGKGAGRVPALYAGGRMGDLRAVWRSDDLGKHWQRINDDGHQWGLRFRVISGDPRVAGRVYLGTDGRGLFYGDPAGERK